MPSYAGHADVLRAFALTAEYYQRPLLDDVVKMYAADLADFQSAAVVGALERMRRDPKRRSCPLPAEVRAYLAPRQEEADSAETIAARITGAVSDCGRTQPGRARAKIGPVGWRAVEASGGWASICQRLTASQVPSFQAQMRELCRSYLQLGTSQGSERALGDGGQVARVLSLAQRVSAAKSLAR